MTLERIKRIVGTAVSSIEISVIGVQRYARACFQGQLTESLGQAYLRLERPTVRSDVDHPAVVVLSPRRRDSQARADDQVLRVVLELRQVERRSPVEIDRQTKRWVSETVDDALNRLVRVYRRSGQPGVRRDNVELGGLAPQVEYTCIREHRV